MLIWSVSFLHIKGCKKRKEHQSKSHDGQNVGIKEEYFHVWFG